MTKQPISIEDPESKKAKENDDVHPLLAQISWQSIWHECLAMFLFVFVCCGSVSFPDEDPSTLFKALTFGLCITTLVYATAHTSGGQINSAVTVALMVSGDLNWIQGLCNIVAQIIGAMIGALFIWFCKWDAKLGVNQLPGGTILEAACIGEFIGTYLLCFVVFQTAVARGSISRSEENSNPVTAPIAIGFAVFLAHVVLVPLTSCSINFPRSFGPAVIRSIEKGKFNGDGGVSPKGENYFWIYFLMPHLAGVCAGLQRRLNVYLLDPVKED